MRESPGHRGLPVRHAVQRRRSRGGGTLSAPRPPGLSQAPVRLGLALCGALLLGFVGAETALDRWPLIADAARGGALARAPEGVLRDFRIAIVHCLMVGYLPAAYVAVLATGRRTVFALQDALACTSAECDRLAGSLRVPRRGLLIAALIGLGVGFVGPYLVPPVPESPWNPADWSAEVAWHRVLGPLTSLMGAALIFAVVVVSRRMSAIAEELETIDLFDPDVLLPFTRQGLTYALLAVGYLSIASLMVVTETGFGVIGGVMAASVLFVAVVALVLPLRGVHRRIERAKAEELAWIDAEIGERTSAFKASREVRTTGELADLVAYRGLVERVREWPIGTSSWLRFALYLLIPVGSWALAALVEHVVDRILS